MLRLIISGAAGGIGTDITKLMYGFEDVDQIVLLYRKTRPMEVNDDRVVCIRCDLSDAADVENTISEIGIAGHTVGIHCAADVSWNKKLEDIYGANVSGSLHFAKMVSLTGKKNAMIYLSTAFTDTENWTYKNTYEESKAIAEKKIRSTFPDLPLWVFGFSLVVGRSDTGEISKFHGFYPMLKSLFLYPVPFIVGRKDALADIVPIDWLLIQFEHLVRTVIRHKSGSGYKLVASAGENKISLGELLRHICGNINSYRGQYGLEPIEEPVFISTRRWNFLQRSSQAWGVKDGSPEKVFAMMDFIDIYKNYLESDDVLPPQNTLFPAPNLRDYLENIIGYWFYQNKQYVLSKWEKQKRREILLSHKKEKVKQT